MNRLAIWHKRIYWFTLFGVAVGLPLNKIVLSLSGLLMALNWIVEGKFKEKFKRLKAQKIGLLLAVLFCVLAFTLVYSEDVHYGVKDLRIKLPLLLFPVVIFSSEALSITLYRRVVAAFVISVTAVTIINYTYFLLSGNSFSDARQMSLFDSHIRLSLMVTIVAFLAARAFFIVEGRMKLIPLILVLWMMYYTHKSEVLTGYFSFIIAGFTVLLWYVFSYIQKNRILITLGILTIAAALIYWLYLIVYPIPKEQLDKENLPEFTELGGRYQHNKNSVILENGYYIHYFVCPEELDSVWKTKTGSSLLSNENENLYPTLLRYMTSLGLRKDALGFDSLSEQDIQNVLDGHPSIIYAQGGFRSRLARITMEIQKHLEGADPNGSTIQQRIEYWRTGCSILKANPILGVGIGDVQKAFDEKYIENNSRLLKENRLHTHQQFLTIWIGAGIIGFLIFVLYILLVLRKAIQLNSYPLIVVWTVISFSYFFEDTLETQVGATLAAFLVSFILHQEQKVPLFKSLK
jgi:hypothetical protein